MSGKEFHFTTGLASRDRYSLPGRLQESILGSRFRGVRISGSPCGSKIRFVADDDEPEDDEPEDEAAREAGDVDEEDEFHDAMDGDE